MLFLLASIICFLTPWTSASVVLNPNMRSFGTALKAIPYTANTEATLFDFSETPGALPHTITEQWFAVFGPEPNADARIRVYIDGEADPSLDFQLYFAHMVGIQSCESEMGQCNDPRVPWASDFVSHLGRGGALKNTYRIPFSGSIRITIEMPGNGGIYYYVRGMTNLPVIVGDLELPPTARLKLYKNWDVTVPPIGKLPLIPAHASSGILFASMWSAHSDYIGFMEGCVRADIDGGDTLLLSSGTEDYFESANFFSAGHPSPADANWTEANTRDFNATGEAWGPESGVSYLNGTNPGPYSMAAYKFHVSDPVVWWNKISLTASNFDEPGCIVPPSPPALVKPLQIWTYTWTYEW